MPRLANMSSNAFEVEEDAVDEEDDEDEDKDEDKEAGEKEETASVVVVVEAEEATASDVTEAIDRLLGCEWRSEIRYVQIRRRLCV
jgi:hypothetical protein